MTLFKEMIYQAQPSHEVLVDEARSVIEQLDFIYDNTKVYA